MVSTAASTSPSTLNMSPKPCKNCATRNTVAARRDFFVKSVLHFSKFLVNANFDLVTRNILKAAINNDSIDILYIGKYYKLFTQVECISFLHTHYENPLKPMDEKNLHNLPFPLGYVDPLMHQCMG